MRIGTPRFIHSQFFAPPPISRWINFNTDRFVRVALGCDLVSERRGGLQHCLFCLFLGCDRENDNVCRRNSWRQDHSIIVGVHHDEGANQSCGCAPACRPDMFLRPAARDVFDAGRLRKILAEEMGGSGLYRFAILHHRFDAEGLNGARKPFTFCLFSVINRQRKMVASECSVDFQHLDCFFDRFLFRFVRRMALLPQKLRGAQKEARTHFPADHVCPLVDQKQADRDTIEPTWRRSSR